MNISAPLSPTVEGSPEPLPIITVAPAWVDTDTTDDAVQNAWNVTQHNSSSSASTSVPGSTSVSGEDEFTARNRLFPPTLPSAAVLHSRSSSLASKLSNAANRSTAQQLSSGDGHGNGSETDGFSSSKEAGQDSDDSLGCSDGIDEVEATNKNTGTEKQESEHDRRIQALWVKLRDQRDAVRDLRLELSDRRRHLRRLRRKKDEVDNGFISIVREHVVYGSHNSFSTYGDTFNRQFLLMQTSRSDYQSEEASVEQLEDRLDEEELRRETLEIQFFTLLYGTTDDTEKPKEVQAESVAKVYATSTQTSLLGIPVDRPVDTHPLYEQLLVAVAERELARENYADVVAHQEDLLLELQSAIKRERLRAAKSQEEKLRTMLGTDDVDLNAAIESSPTAFSELKSQFHAIFEEDDWDSIQEFSTELLAIQKRVSETTARVDKLRKLCLERGFMRKHLSYHEEYSIFADSGDAFHTEDMSIDQDDQLIRPDEPLAHAHFPILVSNPSHVLELDTPKTAVRKATRLSGTDRTKLHKLARATDEYAIATLLVEAEAENQVDFINRWLFQRLRTSSLEVWMLFNTFSKETRLKVKDIQGWQEDVVYYWSRDGATIQWSNRPLTVEDVLTIDDDDVDTPSGSEKDIPALKSIGHQQDDPTAMVFTDFPLADHFMSEASTTDSVFIAHDLQPSLQAPHKPTTDTSGEAADTANTSTANIAPANLLHSDNGRHESPPVNLDSQASPCKSRWINLSLEPLAAPTILFLIFAVIVPIYCTIFVTGIYGIA